MAGHEAALDRLAVTDVLYRYAAAIDVRDWDALRDCFTDDATLHFEMTGVLPAAAFVARAAHDQTVCYSASQHVVSNVVVEIDGDHATARADAQSIHFRRGAQGGEVQTVHGVYRDHLRREGATWRIARRELTTTWISGNADLKQAPVIDPETDGSAMS